MNSWRSTAAVVAAAFLASCGGDSSGPPPVPTTIVAVTANPVPSATVGTALATAPTFEVRAADGRAVKDVAVSVLVHSGGGTISGTPTISTSGPTPIGTWTLGTTAGEQTVRVTAAGLTTFLDFTVNATAGSPSSIEIVEGDNQIGVSGSILLSPLRVRVLDQYSNPVPSTTVSWSVATGGGSVVGATSVTNSEGIAVAPEWTLGPDDGDQFLSAQVSGASVQFRAVTGILPASITIEAAPPATTAVASVLASGAVTFAVRDEDGDPIVGFPVSVAVTSGGGELADAPAVTSSGGTPIGEWTIGSAMGPQVVTVTVGALPPFEISVLAVADVPASMAIVTGNNQSVYAGNLVPVNPVVNLMDRFGNPVSGFTVNWSVTQGGGTLSATQSSTNASGTANSPSWRLGRFGGPQRIVANANGITVNINATTASDYNVEIVWIGPEPSALALAAFTSAKTRIETIIVGDVPDISLTDHTPSAGCVSSGAPSFTGVIDDIRIYATVEAIDGPGGVLGSAGPCIVRAPNGPTVYGRMRFDSADIDNLATQGRLENVILHEMLHVIGVGTLWSANGFLEAPSTPGVRFTGPRAQAACISEHGGTDICQFGVPVESCEGIAGCGAGTINSHWREPIFVSELMTGYLTAGANPLSAMTVESLGDVGYVVNTPAADPYTVPPPSLMALHPEFGVNAVRMPTPMLPTHRIDGAGRITPIPKE